MSGGRRVLLAGSVAAAALLLLALVVTSLGFFQKHDYSRAFCMPVPCSDAAPAAPDKTTIVTAPEDVMDEIHELRAQVSRLHREFRKQSWKSTIQSEVDFWDNWCAGFVWRHFSVPPSTHL